MLSDKTIEEINRHTDPSSLLAVTVEKLKRIKTPFQVKCIRSVGTIREGEVVQVDQVSVSRRHSLLYRIHGIHYLFRFFQILD